MIAVTNLELALQIVSELSPSIIMGLLEPNIPPVAHDSSINIVIRMDDVRDNTNDILNQFTPPVEGHIQQIVDAANKWDRFGDVLIYCKAGRSRSAAAA